MARETGSKGSPVRRYNPENTLITGEPAFRSACSATYEASYIIPSETLRRRSPESTRFGSHSEKSRQTRTRQNRALGQVAGCVYPQAHSVLTGGRLSLRWPGSLLAITRLRVSRGSSRRARRSRGHDAPRQPAICATTMPHLTMQKRNNTHSNNLTDAMFHHVLRPQTSVATTDVTRVAAARPTVNAI